VGGEITISGGTNLTSSASGSTVTVNLDATLASLTSVTSGSFVTSSATVGVTYTTNTITPTGSDANISLLVNGKGSGGIVHSRGIVGGDVNMQATNTDNTNAASTAGFQAAVGGGSGGDPYVEFSVSGVQTWRAGVDNSASDAFVIAASNALGTSNAASWSVAGALTNAAGITATTGNIAASAGSVSAATTLTATLGDITATNGNLVLVAEGNKMMRTSVASTTTAGGNSIGSVTLVGGTATVSTTSVTASSLIKIWRQSIGATGAAGLGALTVGTIVASTSFVINAVQPADATALQASDVSVIGWEIIN
jgi:hypothetical protein